ncbi:hypothetical protein SK128_009071 [Halocaridina rubra]|uniref:Uncharacterized protein n=1 Tax=Halocaridina rubra TaxID=373956 RepID=A0AAN8XI74_HALRR
MAVHPKASMMSSNLGYWICALALIFSVTVKAQLDNEDSLLGVYLESGMLQGQRIPTEQLIINTVANASASMARGSLNVIFLESMDAEMPSNMAAVLTMASCESTHAWAPSLSEMEKLHIAITDSGCSRIGYPTVLSIPLVSGSQDLVQLFTDLRTMNTLTWDDITLIHDNSISKSEVGDVMSVLASSTDNSEETAITIVDLTAAETSSMRLGKLFSSLGPLPGEPQTRQYMVIALKDEIETIQDLVSKLLYATPTKPTGL